MGLTLAQLTQAIRRKVDEDMETVAVSYTHLRAHET